MLNNHKNLQVFMHLYYKDASNIIIDKLSKIWDGDVYISLINDCENNECIIKSCKDKFNNVHYIYNDNMGNDQYGFLKLYENFIRENTDWVLYIHDKKDIKWLNDLLCIIDEKQIEETETYLNQSYGIIASSSHKMLIYNKEVTLERATLLFEDSGIKKNKESILYFYRSLGTYLYLDMLIGLYCKKINLTSESYSKLPFSGGNIFYINRKILDIVSSIIIDEFFDGYYVVDGTVAHAMERFYYYLADDLKYKVKYI